MNNPEQLLPCPFCGSIDLNGPILIEYWGDHYYPHWFIECNQCPCMMELFTKNKEEIVVVWNTRWHSSQTTTQ